MAEFNQNQDPNQNPPQPQIPYGAGQGSEPEPEHESHLIDEIPKQNKFLSLIKNLLVLVILITVILGSFWISFNLGKKLLMPVKKTTLSKIDVQIPEPPASIAHLQKLDKIINGTKEARVAAKIVDTTTTTLAKPVSRNVVGYTGASGQYYKVQAGYFKQLDNALNLSRQLKANGFETYVRKINNGWRVQVGAFRSKKWAQQLQRSLKTRGFDSVLVFE